MRHARIVARDMDDAALLIGDRACGIGQDQSVKSFRNTMNDEASRL
jgi:hypothetical protein